MEYHVQGPCGGMKAAEDRPFGADEGRRQMLSFACGVAVVATHCDREEDTFESRIKAIGKEEILLAGGKFATYAKPLVESNAVSADTFEPESHLRAADIISFRGPGEVETF